MATKDVGKLNRTNGFSAEIIEKMPIGIIVLDVSDVEDFRSAKILEINAAAAELAGMPSNAGRGKTAGEVPLLAEIILLEPSLRALELAAPVDVGVIPPNPSVGPSGLCRVHAFSLSASRIALTLESGWPQGAAQRAVRETEERFRLLVQGVKDCAILMLDPEGKVLSWNEGAERLQGYRSEEIIGKNYSTFFTLEDQVKGIPEARLRRAREEGHAEDEGWRVRKDGSRFWVSAMITALRDKQNEVYAFAKITRDITEDKDREAAIRAAREQLEARVRERTAELARANRKLQSEVRDRQRAEDRLHALAGRLQKAQEAERARLAREIHDALGQLCTALKMDTAFLVQKLRKEESRLRAKAESALSLVDDLIRSLRRLSTELRPSTLDALGLAAAMEWQAREFESHSGIPCKLHLPEKELALDPERSTAIFRIFQEGLTNVARHARATSVQTDLVFREGVLTLVIHDNGKGFDTSRVERRETMGLLGMKERTHILGGDLKLVSVPGKGTTVTVQIPIALARHAISSVGS